MANNPSYDLEPATDGETDAALRPFIDRFVRKEKRERLLSLFLPLKASKARSVPRELVDGVVASAVIELDRSTRAETAFAKIDPRLEGIFLTGGPGPFRTQFGQVKRIVTFAHSDEELFIAHDGACGLFTFDFGDPWLIVRPLIR